MGKRLELYLTLKCNNNCVFCVEAENRKLFKEPKEFYDSQETFKLLNTYKCRGYDYINFLGGEPLIHPNIIATLSMAKKLHFTTSIATNGYYLADNIFAQKVLSNIDELVISIHGHNEELILNQSRNNQLYENILSALKNINLYFNGKLLKVNCVVNFLNYKFLLDILKFVNENGIKEINYSSMFIRSNEKYLVSYEDLKPVFEEIVRYIINKDINVRFSDFPLCVLGDAYIYANELYFDNRDKFIDNHKQQFVRDKIYINKCYKCEKKFLCQGIDENYFNLFEEEILDKF